MKLFGHLSVTRYAKIGQTVPMRKKNDRAVEGGGGEGREERQSAYVKHDELL